MELEIEEAIRKKKKFRAVLGSSPENMLSRQYFSRLCTKTIKGIKKDKNNKSKMKAKNHGSKQTNHPTYFCILPISRNCNIRAMLAKLGLTQTPLYKFTDCLA